MSRIFDDGAFVHLVEEAVKRAVQGALISATAFSVPTAKEMSLAEYLPVKAAAEIAQVHAATIRQWIRRGSLPSFRAGRHIRIKRGDLDELLARSPRQEGAVNLAERAAQIVDRTKSK